MNEIEYNGPNRWGLIVPTLKALDELGGSGRIEEIRDKIIENHSLSTEIVNFPHTNGSLTKFDYEFGWIRTNLKSIKFLENTSRGVWKLTKTAKNYEWNLEKIKKLIRDSNKKKIDLKNKIDNEAITEIKVWTVAPQPPNPNDPDPTKVIPEPNKTGKKIIIFEKMLGEKNEPGYFAMGWGDFQEDMNNYGDEELKNALEKKKWSNKRINYHLRLKNEMKIGDIIIGRKGGTRRIYGFGLITSSYKFDKDFDLISFGDNHYREVTWYVNFYREFRNRLKEGNQFYDKYYIDLSEFNKLESYKKFPRFTLPPPKHKGSHLYFELKEAIILELKELKEGGLITANQYSSFFNGFRDLEKKALIDKELKKKSIDILTPLGKKIVIFLKSKMGIINKKNELTQITKIEKEI